MKASRTNACQNWSESFILAAIERFRQNGHYIEKGDGRKRPLGIQSVEEKIVQQACVTILTEVFEPTFCGISYGFRPGRSQHDVLDALHEGIERRKTNWILDCDIEGFFDNLDHEILMSLIEDRVTDKRMSSARSTNCPIAKSYICLRSMDGFKLKSK